MLGPCFVIQLLMKTRAGFFFLIGIMQIAVSFPRGAMSCKRNKTPGRSLKTTEKHVAEFSKAVCWFVK